MNLELPNFSMLIFNNPAKLFTVGTYRSSHQRPIDRFNSGIRINRIKHLTVLVKRFIKLRRFVTLSTFPLKDNLLNASIAILRFQ